ncbi:hypothetical protein KOW79_010956 [Hemibagrus wyckioides]|uniref:Histone-lysine N-methyltransferase PRDM9-like n=1 Tax=Hemibagrus wyckioides TaxID=337641 RepID=A0A9D3SIU4_9TELE|nr:hypothetical protein KOW79_010956 [Hemibagrus wyckioides]
MEDQAMQTDAVMSSRGGTSDPVGHITPEHQQNGEIQEKPIKEEEHDEEYFYGGTSSFVEHLTSVDRQNEGFQEKHLKEEEPEDDNYLYCEDCSSFFINKCEVHGLAVFISDTPVPMGVSDRARQTLPPGLEVRRSDIPAAGLGVFNKGETLPVGSHFGPYQGDLVDREEAMDSGYSWVICKRGQCEEYIDAKRDRCANWMRYVNCARNAEEQNLVAFQFRGEIFYRCCQPIKPGQELLVWYEEKYAKDLSITFQYLWNKKCSTDVKEDPVKEAISCSFCPLSYTSQIYLYKHMRRLHRDEYERMMKPSVENMMPTRSTCSQPEFHEALQTNATPGQMWKGTGQSSNCEKGFTPQNHLSLCRSVHTREKPFYCSHCGKNFTRKDNLQTHMRIHTGEVFCCSQCGKSFIRESHLQLHQRIHTGEKPYQCSQCGKSFNQMSAFKRHQRTHTGEKPYQCSHCEKSFSQLGNLQTHQRVHTGEKPFHCTDCGKSFSLLNTLQLHQRIHTGEKPYYCSDCGRSFNQVSALKRHHRIHTREKPHHCSQCGRSFSDRGQFKAHQYVHTGDEHYDGWKCFALQPHR